MASRAHLLPACALGLAVFGCKDAPTQLLVVVDSDLEVPAVLTDVEIIAKVAGRAEVNWTFDITGASGSACTESACPLPLTVGVTPESEDASESASIVVRGLGPSGELVVRNVRTGFVKGQRLAVPVFLASSCRAVQCDPGSTCQGGVCVAEWVEPTMLQPVPERFNPASVFAGARGDAATQVAGRDAAIQVADSGVSPDRGVSEDAGCPERFTGANCDVCAEPFAGDSCDQYKFTQVSAGRTHTCGVLADQTVLCWGSDRQGQSTPPQWSVHTGQRGR